MIVSYGVRLLILCLAAFFLLHFVFGGIALLLAPKILRRTAHMEAKRAADWLFRFRLFAPVSAFLLVACFCVPSYIALEPGSIAEEVGPTGITAATLSLMICTLSVLRLISAWITTSRVLQNSEDGPSAPPVILAGLLRARVIVSQAARSALSTEQLQVAVRHEQAHAMHLDNLKRLLLLLAPNLLPGIRSFRLLKAAWAEYAEWAADDVAGGGSEEAAASLAEALLRIAALQEPRKVRPAALVSAFANNGRDLAIRVERLLAPNRPLATSGSRAPRPWAASLVLALALAVLGVLACTPALRMVHLSLEILMH